MKNWIIILLLLPLTVFSQVSHYDGDPLPNKGTYWWGTAQIIGGTGTLSPLIKHRYRLTYADTTTTWTTIQCGFGSCVGIKPDSTIWTWGAPLSGSLGNGSTTNHITTPTQVGTSKWIAASIQYDHLVAIKSDGTIWACGENGNSQLGDGGTTDKTTLTQIGTDNDWVSVSAGVQFTMAIKSNGKLYTWGSNGSYRTGLGTNTGNTSTPTQVGTDTDWSKVSAGAAHTVAVKTGGTLWTWGGGAQGRLGNGSTSDVTAPAQRGSATNWSIPIALNQTSFAIRSDGTMYSTGLNQYGRTGLNTTANTNTTSFTQVGTDADWAMVVGGLTIAYGTEFAVARKTNGTLYATGLNNQGQIGLPLTTTEIGVFTRLGPWTDVVKIAAMSGAFIVVRNSTRDAILSHDDEMRTTYPSKGMFWFGTNQSSNSNNGYAFPMVRYRYQLNYADTSTTWRYIGCGHGHCGGLRADSTLWTWGDPTDGRLGNGSTTTWVSTPTQVGTAKYKELSVGHMHNLAIKSDGSLWAWGDNAVAQLGDGTTTDRSSPTQIGSATDWAKVSAGHQHSMAIKTDNTLYSWGTNASGRTGQGTTTGNTTSPTQVGVATNWSKVSAGQGHTLAIKTDGTLWACGAAANGRMGNGTTTPDVSTITQIGSATDWLNVYAFNQHSFATKTNNTAYSCGLNRYGRTGLNSVANSNTSTFTQVGTDSDWSYFSAPIALFGHGIEYTIGVKTNGALYSTGLNSTGQLGLPNSYTEQGTFVRVGRFVDVRNVASMAGATFIVRN